MRSWGISLGRRWLAWIFAVLGLDLTEKKTILRDMAGIGAPPSPFARASARFLLARSLGLVFAEHPAVFLAFPLSVLVIVASGVAHWARFLVDLLLN